MFLMPSEPGNPRRIDPAWSRERDILKNAGEAVYLIDHDILMSGDAEGAFIKSGLPDIRDEKLVYRGWMTGADDYAAMERFLVGKGYAMLDTAESYRLCHHAPGLMEPLSAWMMPATMLPEEKFHEVAEFLLILPRRPVVIKDWVKSESGLWNEACYIPDPHDIPAAMRVINRFIELRGDYLTGGLIFREYTELSKDDSGRAAEFRAFCVDGRQAGDFIRRNGPPEESPPVSLLSEIASRVPARFFSVDFARKKNGEWLLIEVGYGGVSGIEEHSDPSPVLLAVAQAAREDNYIPVFRS